MPKSLTIPKKILSGLVEKLPDNILQDKSVAFKLFEVIDAAYKEGFSKGQIDGIWQKTLENLPAVGGFH